MWGPWHYSVLPTAPCKPPSSAIGPGVLWLHQACMGSRNQATHCRDRGCSGVRPICKGAASSANGRFLPPVMIFPYKKLTTFNPLEDFPKARFETTPNGWITGEVFLTCLRDVFIKEVESVKKPLALFVDGHASHTALIETSDLSLRTNIVFNCLKSHSSNIIQPIDLAFIGAVKVHWERQVQTHARDRRGVEPANFRSGF